MTENEKQKSGILRVFFIEFAVKPSEFDRGFLGRSELILPSKSPLTPSFVGSNPATPAMLDSVEHLVNETRSAEFFALLLFSQYSSDQPYNAKVQL